MPLRDEMQSSSRRTAHLALFLAFALVIGLAERAIPFQPPVPGVRLGLANVVVLVALYLFPAKWCLILTLLKCVMTNLFAGSFVSLAHSVSGSLLSLAGMYLLIHCLKNQLSPVGVSVVGAALHNTGQLISAAVIMRSRFVFAFYPLLLVSAVITGLLTGIAAKWSLYHLRKHLRW